MINLKAILVVLIMTISFTALAQRKDSRHTLGKEYAQRELQSTLNDESQHNVIDHKSAIVKDSLTAVHVAESILFGIYGKNNIIKQRPYEIYFLDNYWVIIGTLPKGHLGGTFLIIINSLDNKIIKLTHGK